MSWFVVKKRSVTMYTRLKVQEVINGDKRNNDANRLKEERKTNSNR